ncbi:hypothetical protein [Epilithonimonas sp.]|uniref:hypothetical protein n=1 Tax=Epilithonimonas sp. TaxID=2894511 RepID=UPI0028989023|nr:hypothetical protein [Epilithonimonas sp.]
MKPQIIEDHNGNPTGVFIPIKEWEELKQQYPRIEDKNSFKLSDGQKMILDNQDNLPLSEYQDNNEFVAELKQSNYIK